MLHNTAQRNLAEAAEIEKSSNWTIARLIASSVAGKQGSRSDIVPQGTKLGTTEAAKTMGRSKSTILAYLNAWNAAAADGLCAPSSDLTPEDGWAAQMPDDEDWDKYKNPNSHSAPAKVETIPATPVQVSSFKEFVSQATPEQKREVVADLIREDSSVETTARHAVEAKATERQEAYEPIRQRAEQERKAQSAEDSKATGLFKWMDAIGYLADAKKNLKSSAKAVEEATDFLSTRNFRGEAKERLEDSVAELVSLAHAHYEQVKAFDDLLKAGSNDWDADLAALLGGDLK